MCNDDEKENKDKDKPIGSAEKEEWAIRQRVWNTERTASVLFVQSHKQTVP